MVVLSYSKMHGQSFEFNELVSFEYSLVPSVGETEARMFNLSFTTKKATEIGLIGLSLSYSNHQFSFFEVDNDLENSLEVFHIVEPRFFYSGSIKNNWSLNISMSPILSSSLINDITNEDLIYNGKITISKDWYNNKNFNSFTLGIGRGQILGEPQFFPIISFNKEIGERLSYSLGFPKSGLWYLVNERNLIHLRGMLSGIYANTSATTIFNGDQIQHTKLKFSGLDIGLEHIYRLQPNISATTRIGFLSNNSLELLDSNQNLVYNFEPNGSAYLTMGIKYNLNKK
ncbi:hypothetical protein [Croceitalea rosinachiae]|uniref:Outer membrane protein beta-barrel domain-containing protein n=1 Tax=Croceitalea rosinachiae TaxID=3075596 RepID=A0ABU3A9D0_9FLAO|nr:hypothetical protein [Croceitalea sp. F388]MDT0606804.1 hypothetical protein [Croceitalea sp. F388]